MCSLKSMYYLGIDIGSSSVKAMVVDADGVPLAVTSASYPTSCPRPGHVEQDPDDWYRASCIALADLIRRAEIQPERIEGIGLSGTSHVSSLLDDDFKVIRPAILWSDQRSDLQVRQLAQEAGDLIVARTGNSINCTWSLPQITWLRQNEPEAFSRIRHILFSKDYLAYRLTGELTADPGSAVSSQLVDVHTLEWDQDLLRLAGLKLSCVSPIHSSTTIIGYLTREAARDLGLRQGVPVVSGMLDSAAELIGVGATGPSVGVIRLGSAGGVMTISWRPEWRKGCMLYPHPIQPLWYHQAGTNAATTSLKWAVRLFGIDRAGAPYSELDRLVGEVPAGADGLLFHPYLLGERAPFWNSYIRGGFSGVTMDHDRPSFLRAVLEGVAYSLRDCTVLLEWNAVSDIRICGGGAASRTWCQIIADVLGLPVCQMRLRDASAIGAALAAVAGCSGRELAEIAQARVKDSSRIEPDMENHETYNSAFQRYREVAEQYLRIFSPQTTPTY